MLSGRWAHPHTPLWATPSSHLRPRRTSCSIFFFLHVILESFKWEVQTSKKNQHSYLCSDRLFIPCAELKKVTYVTPPAEVTEALVLRGVSRMQEETVNKLWHATFHLVEF